MKSKMTFILLAALLLPFAPLAAAKVGLVVMATGKYISFAFPLINSAEKYFCKNHQVTYFIFTDGKVTPRKNVVFVYQPKLGWPFDTMNRFQAYYNARQLLSEQDYIFACDADMLFAGTVGDEILGERVATRHPFFMDRRGTYETNPISTAYVSDKEGQFYFCGGFYGGSRDEFFKLTKKNMDNIKKDLLKGFIAIWHDESHLNRYFIDNKPTLILPPSYCYPQDSGFPCEQKLIALNKNHGELRK